MKVRYHNKMHNLYNKMVSYLIYRYITVSTMKIKQIKTTNNNKMMIQKIIQVKIAKILIHLNNKMMETMNKMNKTITQYEHEIISWFLKCFFTNSINRIYPIIILIIKYMNQRFFLKYMNQGFFLVKNM